MPLGSLREQLTFPDSYAVTAEAARKSLDQGGGGAAAAAPPHGSAAHKRGGEGGDSDSGEDEGGGAALAAGGARRGASLRGIAAGAYRRLSGGRSKPLGGGGGMLGSTGLPVAAPAASPALDAELRALLDAVCLPSLLVRWVCCLAMLRALLLPRPIPGLGQTLRPLLSRLLLSTHVQALLAV
jgi:hypothetical protein